MSKFFDSLKLILFIFLIISLILLEFDYMNAEKNDDSLKLPPFFLKNEGQIDPGVKYYEWMNSILFTEEGIFFYLCNDKNKIPVKLEFIDSKKESKFSGEEKINTKVNYFIGDNDSSWIRDIKGYRKVHCNNIYSNIDIEFNAEDDQVYLQIIVKPEADITDIKLSFDAIDFLGINEKGLLTIGVKNKKYIFKKPIFFQNIKGKTSIISGDFYILDKKSFGFRIAKRDRKFPLIIKQVLIEKAYFDRKIKEIITKRISDNSKNIYITGCVAIESLYHAVNNSIGKNSDDAIVIKLHSKPSSLMYLLFLGGSSRDYGVSISTDSLGNIYLTGDTSSKDFPVRNAFQKNYKGGGTDVFITKINTSGDDLTYSTYIGGSNHDIATDITIDNKRNAYVTGSTKSLDFPTKNPFQPQKGGYYDAFVVKTNEYGTSLIYSTYLGGDNWDAGFHIKADDEGNIFVTGCTKSLNFPLKDPVYSEYDESKKAFANMFNYSGNELIYSTYLPLNSNDCRSVKPMELFEDLYFK